MHCFRKKIRSAPAYSLVEVMMVLAVFSTVAAGGIMTITNVTRAAENTKLQRDVAVINRAIRVYLVNGGTFLQADLRSPAAVLRKLKTRASKDS
ncbi:MAG TPA: type II secretion system protein, partial [Verrucomicrobiales bacterium]|nr:type II secretion system protein [Verrucomicrobiales bacterium]